MPADEELLCYNKGCGKTFRETDNNEDACTHHPGAPFFHDAYKGWSCCNKRTVDFTEFLNFKGCTRGLHSNVKPVEPEKPAVTKLADDEVMERKPAAAKPAMTRPAASTPLIRLSPHVAPSLAQQVGSMSLSTAESATVSATGATCRRAGCRATGDRCVHHPGYPVFHEGMKYWTCCQKKTTEFSVFLDQVGCADVAEHDWATANSQSSTAVTCRHDWHQTGDTVVVSIFAKRYDPALSSVELSPVRLLVRLQFPEQKSDYSLDVQLRGVVDVGNSAVSMFGTKVEVKLKKAEPGSWATLGLPGSEPEAPQPPRPTPVSNEDDDEPVDLGEL